MTRKHFRAIAETLRCLKHDLSPADHATVCYALADTLKGFNGAFDKCRFLVACNLAPAPGPPYEPNSMRKQTGAS